MGSSNAAARLIIFAFGLTLPLSAWAGCSPSQVDIRTGETVSRFRVEIADTAQERSLGLMFREKMASSAGMLFVYDSPQHPFFWMKNTLIPLDIIFADESGTVTQIQPNAVPLDESPLDGGPGVWYVLEINGGLSKRLGIAPGSALRHPAIGTSVAAWPCASD